MPRPQDSTGAAATAPIILVLFLLSLIMPSYFFLGGMRLTPTRLLLLATFIPLLIRLLTGAAGRIRASDVFLMLFSIWMVLTLVYHHGMERFPYAMISVVELLGGYLIGRVLVRNATDFTLLFRCAFWVLVVLFPFVIVELLTDRNILQEISRLAFPTYVKADSSYGRIGLNRVMAGFEHPILYGLFCAAVFGPILAVLNRGLLSWILLVLFLGFMTFASLSSAPLLALAIQLGLMAWGWMTGGRWWVLVALGTLMYVTVDLLSNRTPVTILINYITFDPGTAWTRILIWEYGSAEVWRHPFVGIGMNDWIRPSWLTSSVDNFWLVVGMRHGAVGAVLVMAALGASLWAVMRAKGLEGQLAQLRRNYVLALVATYVVLCTVHIWGDSSSMILLLIGAGVWLSEPVHITRTQAAVPSKRPERTLPYSRFPLKTRHLPANGAVSRTETRR
ncbi:MAG: O-antigen ligase family protein [Tabrizicola sp.]|jgi:hypothetical protein|nr:O-antigen ligase family protein [Tabrizicola sp.]